MVRLGPRRRAARESPLGPLAPTRGHVARDQTLRLALRCFDLRELRSDMYVTPSTIDITIRTMFIVSNFILFTPFHEARGFFPRW